MSLGLKVWGLGVRATMSRSGYANLLAGGIAVQPAPKVGLTWLLALKGECGSGSRYSNPYFVPILNPRP